MSIFRQMWMSILSLAMSWGSLRRTTLQGCWSMPPQPEFDVSDSIIIIGGDCTIGLPFVWRDNQSIVSGLECSDDSESLQIRMSGGGEERLFLVPVGPAPLKMEDLKHACFSTFHAWKQLSCVFRACFRIFHAQNILSCMFHAWKLLPCIFHSWNMHESVFHAWNMHGTCMKV